MCLRRMKGRKGSDEVRKRILGDDRQAPHPKAEVPSTCPLDLRPRPLVLGDRMLNALVVHGTDVEQSNVLLVGLTPD